MTEDRYSFADSPSGIGHMMYTFAHLSKYGYTVRRETVPVLLGGSGKAKVYGVMHNLIAAPPMRPNRAERKCNVI